MFVLSIGVLAYLTLNSISMTDKFSVHEDTLMATAIHEIFLVLRFLAVGFNILLVISLIAFIYFLVREVGKTGIES